MGISTDGPFPARETKLKSGGQEFRGDSVPGDPGPYDDTVRGGSGNDRIFGETGDDLLFGGSGKDLLDGGIGDDQLDGGSGDDMLIGGDGCDRIAGGGGNDVLTGDREGRGGGDVPAFSASEVGGGDSDVFIFAAAGGNDIITDFEVGIDRLQLIGGVRVRTVSTGDVNGDDVPDTIIGLTSGRVALLNVSGITKDNVGILFEGADTCGCDHGGGDTSSLSARYDVVV